MIAQRAAAAKYWIAGMLPVIACGIGASAAEKTSAAPSDGVMAAALKPFVDGQVIAGAVVLVTDKDKVLDLETIGYADNSTQKPMQADDLFYIASMTKCFTSAGLMMLVDEGKVNIDDPVEKYLPEFKGQMVQETDDVEPHAAKHPMTLKEAMSHTAGFRKNLTTHRYTLADEMRDMAASRLQWDPGTSFKYSEGIELAGRVIELISGKPYPQYMRERLLDPLALEHTAFWPDAQQASHLALTHDLNPETKRLEPLHLNAELVADSSKCGDVPPIILSQFPANFIPAYAHHFARASGSLFSTAEDIATFCRMLLNNGTYKGRTYLTPEAVETMSSVQTGDLAVGGGGKQGYGLGFFVQKKHLDGGVSVGSYGHHGSRKTQLWIDPANGIAMVLMVQCNELTNKQLEALYAAYQNAAIARYGNPKH